MRLLVVIFVTLVSRIVAQQNCPAKCLCFGTTVRCMFLNLHRIPDDMPADTTVLDLRFNKIREIKPGVFKNLTHLTTLLLNNNHLRKLEEGAFDGLSELRNLYLYKNHIHDVSAQAFQGLGTVEQIFLHENLLEHLPAGIFSDLASLRRLRLDSNSLVCDCRMMWLSEMLRSSVDFSQATVTCESPDPVKGQSLAGMTRDDFHCKEPEFTVEPDDLEVKFGGTAYFTCRAEGDPDPEILWRKDSKEITTNSLEEAHYSVLADGTLTIEAATQEDSGVYECVARNAAGEKIARSATLKIQADQPAQQVDQLPGGVPGGNNIVQEPELTRTTRQEEQHQDIEQQQQNQEEPHQGVEEHNIDEQYQRQEPVPGPSNNALEYASRPRITRAPQDYNVVQGESIALECRAVGTPNPTITWTLNDLPLPQDPRYRMVDSSTLIVDGVGSADRGLFRCVATNIAGSTSANSRVSILVPPSISERPSDQTVTEGLPAYFTCRVTGTPNPQITWYKDGRLVAEYGDRYPLSGESTTIWIDHVALRDAGTYECHAQNNAGRTEAIAVLNVNPRVSPVMLRTPEDALIQLGETAEFTCVIRAEPPAQIQWLKDGRSFFTSSKYQIAPGEQTLLVRSANHGDEGLYECIAQNVAGQVSAVARLSIISGERLPNNRFPNNRPADNNVGRIDNSVVRGTVLESIHQVGRAFNSTLSELHDPTRTRTPGDLFTLLRLPSSQEALQLSRSAEVFERSISMLYEHIHSGMMFNVTHKGPTYDELLTPFQLDIIADLSGCAAHRRVINCDNMCYHHKYRTFDGTCNNLRHPMQGASLTPLNRLLPPRYENNFNTPPGWDVARLYNGFRLPSARRVSTHLMSAERGVTEDEDFTHMLMQWGQFHDHDITFVPQAVSNARFSDGRRCNETCENQSPCFPIPIPRGDPRIRRHSCMGVTRSSGMCGSGVTSVFWRKVLHREQMNQITAYIDASSVYGSSEDESRNLRDFSTNNGLLRTGRIMPSGKPLLPPNVGEPIDCQMDPNVRHIPCFQAGDHRNNEQLGLLSMHTLWMREHNRLATELRKYNQHWDGDTLYHETRKIIGAMFQHITFTHWLPKILGPVGMERLGTYTGYKPDIDATIFNSFSTAAFRFGHGLIHPIIYRLNETMQPTEYGNLPLHKAFFAPFRLVEEGGVDPIIRGLYGVAAKSIRPREFVNTELTERLFMLAHEVALDLAALNIQRGRDHGLPTYNDMRKKCGMQQARTFDELASEIPDLDTRAKLRDLYGHPDNIDLWVGGMSELRVRGARIGPTFMCILIDQFRVLRDGDRFWYENPGVFSPAQLLEIKSANLARVVCDNSDNIHEVPRDVFVNARFPEDYIDCEADHGSNVIPKIDIKVWASCCHDCARSGNFRSLTGQFARNRRSTEYSFPDDRPQNDSPTANEDAGTVFTRNAQNSKQTCAWPPCAETKLDETSTNRKNKTVEDEEDLDDGSDVEEGAAEEEDHHDHHGAPHGHEEHSMMDVVDSRIEGMEEMMNKVMKTMHRLTRKLRKMEQHMDGSSHRQRLQHHGASCEDSRGAIRKHDDKWREHDCRVCQCKNGVLECVTETCQLPTCESPVKIPGQCCPVCH